MGTSSDEMWWRRSMLYNGCCASCILDKQVSTLRLHKETTFFSVAENFTEEWENYHRGTTKSTNDKLENSCPFVSFRLICSMFGISFQDIHDWRMTTTPEKYWKVPTKSTRWGKVLMISKYDDDWYTDTRNKAATWVWSCGLKIVILAF